MSVAGTQIGSLRASGVESRRLALAFAISIAAHLLCWGGYELGKELKLWHLPAWFHLAKKKQPQPQLLTQIQNSQPPTVFVDVNPDQVSTEAPKNTPYYSDKNSRAANPKPSDSDVVKFTGKQTEMVKTENVPRPSFSKSQPSSQSSQSQEEEQPKPSLNPGDLNLGKPENEQQQTQESEQQRPRTIRQALAQNHLPGLQMRQEGGVLRNALVSSLDVQATPFGDYDSKFIAAVTDHWYDLLDRHNFAMDRSGKVTLQFHLNYDGSISEVKILDNTVGDVLGYVCEEAVTEPAPYERWPGEMRRKIEQEDGKDYREITFTFYYY